MTQTTRPPAPITHANPVEHLRRIAVRANQGLPMDGSDAMKYPLPLKSYTVATLPAASVWGEGLVYISDEPGGAVLAFSDGSNWIRLQDSVSSETNAPQIAARIALRI